MSADQSEISGQIYGMHTPCFEAEASELNSCVARLTVSQLAEALRISPALAQKTACMSYDFTNKSTGCQAAMAFTGEVFKSLDYGTLTDGAKAFAFGHLLIVSSLYGMLRPDDIVKPYRFEFGCDVTPGNVKVSRFWKPKLTVWLVKHIKERRESEILNLLPEDASKCVDWKIVRAFARVERPIFKTAEGDGTFKTPHTGRLKELRGLMAREIMMRHTDRLDGVLSLETDSFYPFPEQSRPGMPVFAG